MKVATRVMAGLLVLAVASAASATTHTWFTASNPLGGAQVITPGGPGSAPFLKCDATAAFCSWTISMAFANDAGDSPVIGWATDLYTDAVPGKITVDTGSVVYGAGFSVHASQVVYGPAPLLVGGMSGFDGSFAGLNSNATMGSFTLRKVKQGTGGTNMDTIFGVVGDQAWANLDGNAPDLDVGGNVVPGPLPGDSLGPIMTIMNFPEPSSLSLLGLGALALIRRRR